MALGVRSEGTVTIGTGNFSVIERHEADLREGFLAGDGPCVEAVTRLVDRALSARSLNLGDAREDVRQETLRRLVVAFRGGQFRGEAALATYVHKVAHGAAIDHWRRFRRRREEAEDDHPEIEPRSTHEDPTELLERSERRVLAHSLLARLSASCRALMTQVYFDEAPYADIARALRKSEGAIKVQVHRCRHEAFRILRDLAPGGPDRNPTAPGTPKTETPPPNSRS